MALTAEEQQHIEALAIKLVDYFNFERPPIPVEKILSTPPDGLNSIDISDLSLVFGIGEHRYEYRMALARLLYREVCRASVDWDVAEYPYNNDAARYFAAGLLIPVEWVIKAIRRPLANLQQLSEDFQVPEYAMASRLVQLGKRVKGMS